MELNQTLCWPAPCHCKAQCPKKQSPPPILMTTLSSEFRELLCYSESQWGPEGGMKHTAEWSRPALLHPCSL